VSANAVYPAVVSHLAAASTVARPRTPRPSTARPSPMTGFGSRFLAFVLAPVLFPQSRVVLANLPILPEADHDWEGEIAGPDPLRLLVLGDSTGAGVGVESLREGLAGNLAEGLLAQLGRGVSWQVIARSGATTGQIREFFLLLASRQRYDVIFLTLGVNDVMQLRRKGAFQYDLEVIVRGLTLASPNAQIMLAGIPRMEHFSSLPAPLGTILGARAYRLNAAAHAVLENYPTVVHVPPWPISLPGFFAADDFHPSALGYREWAQRSIAYWLRKR
jgi:lysophospholipase L1-like esterase